MTDQREQRDENGITRRQAIGASVVGAATIGVAAFASSASGASGTASASTSPADGTSAKASATRMPLAFVPHGGGPWPFVDLGLSKSEVSDLTSYLQSVRDLPKTPPKALLVISAHWEERVPTVMTSEHPPDPL